MNPVDWFEIPVTDINRAKKCCEDDFGLQIFLNELGPLEMGFFLWTIMYMRLQVVVKRMIADVGFIKRFDDLLYGITVDLKEGLRSLDRPDLSEEEKQYVEKNRILHKS